jgi:hypothetical protein
MKDVKEKIDQDKIDQLKTRHPEGIYEGEISFDDDEEKSHKVEFIYRKPTTADMESFSKSAQKNPLVANLNLIQSLILHPEPGPVIAAIRDYPAATNRFCEEAILPFFGANVSVRKRKM